MIKKILIGIATIIIVLFVGILLAFKFYSPPLSEKYGNVDTKLFLGNGEQQPLIVAFGGSQGGNTWAEEYWSDIRSKFIDQRYAVLAIGYFKSENTPEVLDRISLDAIHDTIMGISNHPKINRDKIALLGSSRGAELVLNLASRYEDFDAVVALVPSCVTFPSLTLTSNTSAWTFKDEEVDFVTMPLTALGPALRGETVKVIEIALANEDEFKDAIIPVEHINGSVLLLSAKDDATWPSKYMSDVILNKLTDHGFKYHFEHFSFDGGHHDTKKHFGEVFEFLGKYFK